MNSKNNICEISNIHYEIINNILTDDNSKALCLEQVKKEEPHQSNNTELLRFSRHISLDIYFNNNEDKSDNVDNILKELSSISSANTYQEDDTILILQLSGIVDKMLSNLSQADKSIYLYRYFYAYSLEDIASLCKTTASNAEKVISQCNNKLKDLIEETKLITDNKSLLLSFTDIDNSHLLSLTASSTSKKEIVKPDSPTRKSRKISIPVLLNIILSITLVLSIGIIVIQYTNF